MKKLLLTTLAALGCLGFISQGYANIPCGEPCGSVQCAPPCIDTCCPCASFDGWYIGANVGWAFHDRVWVDRDTWTNNFGTDFSAGSHVTQHDGVSVGLQLGYNLQCGCTLLGLEADASWANLDRTTHFSPEDAGVAGTELSIRDRLHWFGTIRGRAGIIANDLLLFVTAGAAWASVRHEWEITDPTVPSESFSDNRCRWGLALGTGVEWLWCENFTIKAEALCLRFPQHTRSGFSPAGPDDVHFDLIDKVWVARIGFNYRFCL